MLRDFSEESKQTMLGLVYEVENEKLSNFTDWVGDRWFDFEELIGQLNIAGYINNVNDYHKKVIDKNNATEKSIEKIFTDVANVNQTYSNVFQNVNELLEQWNRYIIVMQGIVSPTKGNFSSGNIKATLNNILTGIEKEKIDCLRDNMVKEINGELVFNEELLYEYIKKNPAEMTDAEQALLIEVIAQLQDTVAMYETAAKIGTDKLGADLWNRVSWVSDSQEYDSFTAVSAHYNQIYVNLLNFMMEKSEDSSTFAASILQASLGNGELNILGMDGSGRGGNWLGGSSLALYVAKYTSEHTEQYYKKLSLSEESTLSSGYKFDDAGDAVEEWLKDKTDDLFKDKDVNKEFLDETTYYDKDGNEIDKKDAPTFYEKQATIAELKEEASASASLYEGNFEVGENGKIAVTVGKAEAHASVSAGFYVIGTDGEKKFSPGVNAEVGASVTAFEAEWEQQWLGDEMLGLNSELGVTAGKAEAKADIGMQVFGDDGKLDIQLGASASAELIGGEIEGSVGVNVLGGEVGVKAGINYGLGAHADIGYRDGVFKCDIGASLGIGVSLDLEVDVGGMVNTVADAAESVWNGAKDVWNDAKDAWNKFWKW